MSTRPVAIIDATMLAFRHGDIEDPRLSPTDRLDENLALCRPGVTDEDGVDHPLELWVGNDLQRARTGQIRRAQRLCEACPVLDACKAYAALHPWSGVVVAGAFVRGSSAGGEYVPWSPHATERRRRRQRERRSA